jgi:hypothetical protein
MWLARLATGRRRSVSIRFFIVPAAHLPLSIPTQIADTTIPFPDAIQNLPTQLILHELDRRLLVEVVFGVAADHGFTALLIIAK